MIFITYPLIWSQAVVDKIGQKHHVTPEEVEEVIYDDKPICHKGTQNSYCVASCVGTLSIHSFGKERQEGTI